MKLKKQGINEPALLYCWTNTSRTKMHILRSTQILPTTIDAESTREKKREEGIRDLELERPLGVSPDDLISLSNSDSQ